MNADVKEHDSSTEAVVVVRGELANDQQRTPPAKDSESEDSKSDGKEKSKPEELSAEKVAMRDHLPALEDDGNLGIQKDHIVTRDGKPDLAFSGTLLASAAPASAPKGQWDEYRIYETTAGKHVFSKINRGVSAERNDTHEAEVFDPAPSSMTSKILKSAHDITHTREKTWADAAADFFGYDSLAKELYRKLGGEFEERIG